MQQREVLLRISQVSQLGKTAREDNVVADELSVQRHRTRNESVLFIGTQFSNLYTAVDTPARGRVGWTSMAQEDLDGLHGVLLLRESVVYWYSI
jgi:hypothetical protein